MPAISVRNVVLATLAISPACDATRRQHFMQHVQRFSEEPRVPDLSKLQDLEEQFMSALSDKDSGDTEDGAAPSEETTKKMQEKLLNALNSPMKAGSSAKITEEMKKMTTEMKEGIEKGHKSAEGILSDIMGAFSKCSVEKGKSEKQLGAGLTTVESKASEHVTCRGKEKEAAVEKKECEDIMKAQKNAKKASCDAVKKITINPNAAADVCHSTGSEDYESWLKRNKDYFIKTTKDYQDAKDACEQATRDLEDQTKKCNGFTGAWKSQNGNCNTLQSEMESATCSWDTERTSSCDGYGDCFKTAKESYDTTTPTLKSQADNRKQEWRAALRIECLLGTFDAKDQTKAIKKCIDKRHATSQLDLKIPAVPAKENCVASTPLPCDGPFTTLRFNSLPTEAPQTTCTPCMINAAAPGNWVVVMKIGQDSTLGYSSALWQNNNLLNENSDVAVPGNAKYSTYLDTPFEKIRMCIGSPDSNCVKHTFDKQWKSAKDLFSAGYIRDATMDRDGILGAFAPTKGAYQNCPMQRPGFNIKCNDNNWARMGFCLNCASQPCQNRDTNDADASIGVGLRGQSTRTEMGAGWTGYFASGKGTCSPNSATFKDAWISVKSLKQPSSSMSATVMPTSWTLIMKIGSDKTFGFSSKYWTDHNLLNQASPATVAGINAKYEAFVKTPFNKIRMCVDTPDRNCVTHKFDDVWKSAKDLFKAGYIRDPSVDRDQILKIFGPKKGSYQNCPMQRPGFNIKCKDGNWARFGFCLNCASQPCQNSDGNDADASIGVGLRGQSTGSEMGAGWTQYFASGKGTCSPNSMKYRNAWLWVSKD